MLCALLRHQSSAVLIFDSDVSRPLVPSFHCDRRSVVVTVVGMTSATAWWMSPTLVWSQRSGHSRVHEPKKLVSRPRPALAREQLCRCLRDGAAHESTSELWCAVDTNACNIGVSGHTGMIASALFSLPLSIYRW